MAHFNQFDYQAYIKDMEARTKKYNVEVTEFKGHNYTKFTLVLPDKSSIVFTQYDDGTKDISYYTEDTGNVVSLREHEAEKYHVHKENIKTLRIQVFGTHLDYDSINDPEEENDGTDL